MSRRKRKWLRSLRSVFVLFVTILLITVVFLLFVKIYLTFSPICPEYNKMVKVALSDKNGYVYFERASDIAKKNLVVSLNNELVLLHSKEKGIGLK
jgi:capsular polysaccharide biosynthesis protein